jgi:secernin
MCDTVVSLKENNLDKGVTYFAKNSDREPGEAQVVEYHPRELRSGRFKTTYVDIQYDEDVETKAIVISRPTWMWGAEMGFNENGVAIGNEAIFTQRKFAKEGLLGMDLLRLGLETANDAREALSTIVKFVERYGQGGSNSRLKEEYYDNSFLICDRNESYILETYGDRWRSERVSGFASISNTPSEIIGSESSKRFGYRLNLLYNYFGKGKKRAETTYSMLQQKKGMIRVEDIMYIMRHHSKKVFHPKKGSNEDICMHSGSFVRRFQTANSMILELYDDSVIAWFTFSSNPCISLYKPVFFGSKEVRIDYNEDYWRKAEKLHMELAEYGLEKYSRAMAITLANQKEIDQVVYQAREMMIHKGSIEAQAVYDRIMEIDKQQMASINSLRS